jgi:hypothetical protein
MNPISVKHGEGNTAASLAAIMALPVESSGDCIDMAIASVLNYTGLRAAHAHAIFSKDCSFLEPGSDGTPRSFFIKLLYDKNLRAGSSSRTETVALEKFVPCICCDLVKGKELQKFKKLLNKAPIDAECITASCPYNHIKRYFSLIPDRNGALREQQKKTDPTLESLKLFRARAPIADKALGDRRFLETPLG